MAKTLSDLYARGKPLAIDDGDGDLVVVYLAKINPVEQEDAVRAGSAKQAVVLAATRDHTSQHWLAAMARALSQPPAALVERLVTDFAQKRKPICDARVAGEDEWSKEGYLDGLRDAWSGGLSDRYALDSTDADAAQVFGELKRFSQAMDAELDAEASSHRRDIEQLTLDALQEQWTDEELRLRGLISFNIEYFKHCLAAAVRLPCERCAQAAAAGERHVESHPERYFADAAAIDALDIQTRAALLAGYNDMTVSPTEGKGSPPPAASSASSAPVVPVETEASSGLADALV